MGKKGVGGDAAKELLRMGDAILDVATGVDARGVDTAETGARDVAAVVAEEMVTEGAMALGADTEEAFSEAMPDLPPPCNSASALSASCRVRPVSAFVCTTWPRSRRACSESLLRRSMSSMAIQVPTDGCRSNHSQISASRLPSATSLVQSWTGAMNRRANIAFIMLTFAGSRRQVLESTIMAPVFLTMRSSKLQHVSRKTSSP
mmetsp:Transcript_82777/g.232054  ORF Transcript_82777/g.232054 Transcript_82777/m.232054 type:complete len:204 (+) Transcript_82777:315-926(+)